MPHPSRDDEEALFLLSGIEDRHILGEALVEEKRLGLGLESKAEPRIYGRGKWVAVGVAMRVERVGAPATQWDGRLRRGR